MLGNHEPVIKLLKDNGAKITSGDVGQFACAAAEKNNLKLLKDIVRLGGDITLANINGSTALHVAVCEGNIEMVEFLLEQGADINKVDEHGWTPGDLAEQQGHEDIKHLFESRKEETKAQQPLGTIPEEKHGVRFLGRFKSEPTILPVPREGSFPALDGSSWGRSRQRRRIDNFHNSLFGIMSAAQTGESELLVPVNQDKSVQETTTTNTTRTYATRLRVSCPEKGDTSGRLILLPKSYQELGEICNRKYGFLPGRILNKDGAEIDEIEVIRDGDHLVFVSDRGSSREEDGSEAEYNKQSYI